VHYKKSINKNQTSSKHVDGGTDLSGWGKAGNVHLCRVAGNTVCDPTGAGDAP